MDDEEGDVGFTVQELIDAELNADMVLGADDGKDCTYSKGYMVRQAVFSCLTCTPAGNAGCCTACSITCHEGHQVVELWTKRHFRCDCGNSKFGGVECKLDKHKERENEENSYNQNFSGTYCSCRRPYPDPDAESSVGEMLQCCICEDWFHEAHLGLVPEEETGEGLKEEDDDFEAVICQGCIRLRCDFLVNYPELLVYFSQSGDEEPASDAVPEEPVADGSEAPLVSADSGSDAGSGVAGSGAPGHELTPTEHPAAATSPDAAAPAVRCRLKQNVSAQEKPSLGTDKAIFLCKGWRSHLCQCAECFALYNSKGLDFLLREGDSIADYEEMARIKREENIQRQEGAERNFIQNLGHVEQIEFINAIREMASGLTSFLTPIAESGRAITSDDIYDVFERLKKRRRSR